MSKWIYVHRFLSSLKGTESLLIEVDIFLFEKSLHFTLMISVFWTDCNFILEKKSAHQKKHTKLCSSRGVEWVLKARGAKVLAGPGNGRSARGWWPGGPWWAWKREGEQLPGERRAFTHLLLLLYFVWQLYLLNTYFKVWLNPLYEKIKCCFLKQWIVFPSWLSIMEEKPGSIPMG